MEMESHTRREQATEPSLVPKGTWRVVPEGSSVGFRVKKLGIYYVKGLFREVEGRIDFGAEAAAPRSEVIVDASSIYTRIPPRDWHLRTKDFLEVKRHPQIRISAQSVGQGADGHFTVPASFEIHGTQRPVELTAHCHAAEGADALALHLSGTLDRHDFGIRARQPVELIVGREIHLDVHLVLERAG